MCDRVNYIVKEVIYRDPVKVSLLTTGRTEFRIKVSAAIFTDYKLSFNRWRMRFRSSGVSIALLSNSVTAVFIL
jgi:hypothetical protein